MCLALIAIQQHHQYPLIILSNRDEFYKRATVPAHYWADAPNVFAGQDLVGGGSWLGVAQNGRFALVTNYRNPKAYDVSLLSRGLLIKDYLQGTLGPSAYIETISSRSHHYNLFNLIVGDLNEVIYYSNAAETSKKLAAGLYGLSNHLIDTPWYKVLKAKELLHHELVTLSTQNDQAQIEAHLLPILEDQTLAPDDLLPQTGISKEFEKSLSSIFVNVPQYDYGTRSSTLLLYAQNSIYFAERGFKEAKILFNQQQSIPLSLD
ncbi:MAG: NRDE family protein [Legionella sp.]